MSSNTFGKIYRISTFGESHGKAIGVVIDGCPAGVAIDEEFIQSEMDRRRPGQSKIVTQRKESDTVQILSGVFEGKSTGTPIGIVICVVLTSTKKTQYFWTFSSHLPPLPGYHLRSLPFCA